jgi:hypothetical protein
MSAAIHSETVPLNVRDQILALWERNRLQCGWFVRPDHVPETRADFRRCLELLGKHGDRATYVLSRKLLKCL